MMGSGKSSIGLLVSKNLINFIDIDNEIEKTKMKIKIYLKLKVKITLEKKK